MRESQFEQLCESGHERHATINTSSRKS